MKKCPDCGAELNAEDYIGLFCESRGWSEPVHDLSNPSSFKYVYTYGVFDILHPDHINVLSRIAQLGDFLIVGIIDDETVRQFKGSDRPHLPMAARRELIDNLKIVDMTINQFSYDPRKALSQLCKQDICPAVIAKGGQWYNDVMDEVALTFGCQVVLLPEGTNYSSTRIINKIREAK